MGIRIHKALGYAYDNLNPQEYKRNWSRELTVKEFTVWCEENIKKIEEIFMSGPYRKPDHWQYFKNELKLSFLKEFDKDVASRDVDDFIHYDPEDGLKKVILFRPIGFDDWTRYDNIIDYVEASDNPDGPVNKLVKYCTIKPSHLEDHERNGIFPFMYRRPPPSVAALCLWSGLDYLYPKL